jgi:hypothetical protein
MIISYVNSAVNNNFQSKQGALDYWYTADETCVSHGPHFNYVLYVTVAHVMASFLCFTFVSHTGPHCICIVHILGH